MKNTIVIGAGLTGLTTAFYLKKAGKDFIVLEQNDRVGGVIKTMHKDGFTFEEGPNTGVIGNESVVALFDELRTCEIEIASDVAKKRYILKDGSWQALPMGLLSAIKTPLFTLKDKFRILGEPFRAKGTDPHETLAHFVVRRMGQSFLDYAIDPFIKGVYSGKPDQLIVKYALPKLYAIEQTYGSLIGGSIKKQFSEKKTEIQKRVSRKTFSAKGGLSTLVESMYHEIGTERFMLSCSSISVEALEKGFKVSFTQNGITQSIEAKHVITTVPAYALSSILAFVGIDNINPIANLEYAPVAEIAIGYKQWKGFEPDGFGGLIPTKEESELLGVLFMSTLFSKRTPEGGVLFNVFMGGSSNPHLVQLSDEALIALLAPAFCKIMKCESFNPDMIQITRHAKAIPQYGIDSKERFEMVDKLQSLYPGLIIGGNLRDGIGMADRIKQGKMMGEKL
jgi:oxygen-dependent protoporphyrinogen oxidase